MEESRWERARSPDLDDVFKNLFGKFGKSGGNGGGSGKSLGGIGAGILVGLLVVIWFISGFYTIREAERGVVLRFGEYHQQVEPGLRWRLLSSTLLYQSMFSQYAINLHQALCLLKMRT